MSAYEELVERCHAAADLADRRDIRLILAEVLRTLQRVTPEMVKETTDEDPMDESGVWLAMLRASPITSP